MSMYFAEYKSALLIETTRIHSGAAHPMTHLFREPQIIVMWWKTLQKSFLFFVTALLLASNNSWANVKLPVMFGDNMVLQRDEVLTIWGWSDFEENVTVDFNG